MIKPLTSLRFFFAFFVFLSHISFIKSDAAYIDIFDNVFDEGFLGVSFFFILSGFILAYNYNDKILERKVSKSKFYIARFARIYPLHLATLICAVPLSLFELWKNLPLNLFLLQSWIPLKSVYFSLNSPSWSISTEAFFYLCFPFLVIINGKLNHTMRTGLVIIFTALVVYLNFVLNKDQIHYWLYISPFIRVFDFILGIFMFELYKNFKKKPLKQYVVNGLFSFSIVLFFIFFYFHNRIEIGFRYSIYYWIPMFSIILFSAVKSLPIYRPGIITRILSTKQLIYLGEISFAFYLIHQLVIRYYSGLAGYFKFEFNVILVGIFVFLFSIICSIFAFEIIEKPFNSKIKKKLYDKIS